MDWKLGFFLLLRCSGRVRFCKLSWGHISKFYVIFPAFCAIFTTFWAHLAETWHSVKVVFALHVFNHLEIRWSNFSPFWPLNSDGLTSSHSNHCICRLTLSHEKPPLVCMHVCVCVWWIFSVLLNRTVQLTSERDGKSHSTGGRARLRNWPPSREEEDTQKKSGRHSESMAHAFPVWVRISEWRLFFLHSTCRGVMHDGDGWWF